MRSDNRGIQPGSRILSTGGELEPGKEGRVQRTENVQTKEGKQSCIAAVMVVIIGYMMITHIHMSVIAEPGLVPNPKKKNNK